MAFPTLIFNNATGSNTAASGAGPGTALFGTNASFTGSVVTLDGSPTLTGVAVDGSAVLWLKTTTGRQYFTISAIDNTAKTVTLNDAPAGTATGRTWGIGGKRATLDHADSRLALTTDVKNDWIFEIQYTGTDYAITSTLTIADKRCTFLATGGRARIDAQYNGPCLKLANGSWSSTQQSLIKFSGFQFICTSGTKTLNIGVDENYGYGDFDDCWFGSPVSGERLQIGGGCVDTAQNAGKSDYRRCRFFNCVSHGFIKQRTFYHFTACSFISNGGDGLALGYSSAFGFGFQTYLSRCISAYNTGMGAWFGGLEDFIAEVSYSVFHANGSDGVKIEMGDTARRGSGVFIHSSVFTSNGGYGLNLANVEELVAIHMADYNAFGSGATANTSGARNNVTAGAHDVTVTTDPFTDSANNNYTPTVGGGLRGAAYPPSTPVA